MFPVRRDAAVAAAVESLDGPLVVLGAGGKTALHRCLTLRWPQIDRGALALPNAARLADIDIDGQRDPSSRISRTRLRSRRPPTAFGLRHVPSAPSHILSEGVLGQEKVLAIRPAIRGPPAPSTGPAT